MINGLENCSRNQVSEFLVSNHTIQYNALTYQSVHIFPLITYYILL